MGDMKIDLIGTREPFNGLFSIDPSVLSAIKEHIKDHGYDRSQPIILWAEEVVVLDGHTRLEAAKQAGLTAVPVYIRPFPDEDAALKYAIHNQRDRRNLTDADIQRCIEAVDKRRDRGGDRRSAEAKSKAPNGALEKSAASTAKIVGVSTRKVERARAVLADPEAAAEVKAGKKTINRAHQEIQARRKSQNQPEPAKNREDDREDDRRAILQEALTEIQTWREKYKDCTELSAIFVAIDGCQLNLERREPLPEAEGAPQAIESLK